jgi:hypothetical protein
MFMKLSYGYRREHLDERFSVQAACTQPAACYGAPTPFDAHSAIKSGGIYVLDHDIVRNYYTKFVNSDVLLVCVHSDSGPFDAECKAISTLKHSKCSQIWLRVTSDGAAKVFEELAELFFVNQAWQEAVWEIQYAGGTRQDFLAVSAELLNDVLYYCPIHDWCSVIYSLPKNFIDYDASGFVDSSNRGYAEIVDYQQFETIVSAREPITLSIIDAHGKPNNMLCIAIRDYMGICVGLLSTPVDATCNFEAKTWQMQCMASALKSLLESRSNVEGVELITTHQLLQHLLVVEPSGYDVIRMRLSATGFPSYVSFFCVAIQLSQNSQQMLPLQLICSVFESMIDGAYAIAHKHYIVVVVGNTRTQEHSKKDIEAAMEYIRPIEMQAGMSNTFEDIAQLCDYANQAQAALETGLVLKPELCIFEFSEVATAYIVGAGAHSMPIALLCAPGIKKLHTVSESGEVDFIATLRAYLRNACNAAQTSKALFIHRSTLAYRLERIADITQMNLNDADDRLYMELSLSLLGLY